MTDQRLASRRHFLGRFAGGALAGALAPRGAFAQDQSGLPAPSVATDPADLLRPKLEFRRLADGVWRHVSWCHDSGRYFPSNGLIIIDDGQALLVDTSCGVRDTGLLVDRMVGVSNIRLVITHAHGDRMKGIDSTRARSIPSFAHERTVRMAAVKDLGIIDQSWSGESCEILVGRRKIELFYPGPAHSADNTVVYIEDCKLLYGGCMVRSLAATNPGGLQFADVCAWENSLKALQQRYAQARIVVPGHGEAGDMRLLAHTAALVEIERKTRICAG